MLNHALHSLVRRSRLSPLKPLTSLLARPFSTFPTQYHKPIALTNLTPSKTSYHSNPRRYFSSTPNPPNPDPKKEDDSTKEKPSPSESKKPESTKEKKSEDSILDQITNTFKSLGEFFSFSDSKDNKSDGKKSGESQGQNFNNWFNENQNLATLGLVVLAGGLVLIVRTDSFHEFIGNFKPITYVELVELIEGSEVDRIRIKRITEGKDMHNKAYIMTRSGNVRV
jgi:hypothetical protein